MYVNIGIHIAAPTKLHSTPYYPKYSHLLIMAAKNGVNQPCYCSTFLQMVPCRGTECMLLVLRVRWERMELFNPVII